MGRAALAGGRGHRGRIAPAALRARSGHTKGLGLSLFAEEAGLDDAAALAALERDGAGSWNEAAFAEAIRSVSSRVVVVRTAGPPDSHPGILAYCALRVVADEMEILGLAVAPGWRRQGLGRLLLRRALSLGRALGALTAFLEVREGNDSAIGLYRSLGFCETGRRRSYYRDPEEDALVLSRSLGGNTVSSGPRDS